MAVELLQLMLLIISYVRVNCWYLQTPKAARNISAPSSNIRFAGKPLGRPPKITPENKDELLRLKAQRRQEYRERIPIEGKFNQGKYGYRLNNLRAKRADTSLKKHITTNWFKKIKLSGLFIVDEFHSHFFSTLD